MSETELFTTEEIARLIMLTGAIHDLAEIERTSKDHDDRMRNHLKLIADEMEKILTLKIINNL